MSRSWHYVVSKALMKTTAGPTVAYQLRSYYRTDSTGAWASEPAVFISEHGASDLAEDLARALEDARAWPVLDLICDPPLFVDPVTERPLHKASIPPQPIAALTAGTEENDHDA